MGVWKDVPGFGGHYQASDDGQIRTKRRVVEKRHRTGLIMKQIYQPKLLSQQTDTGGYKRVHIGWNNRKATPGVHALVCAAWHGERPEGLVCCHADGDPTNNRPSNLRWDTQAANNADRLRHGTYYRGVEHHAAKHDPRTIAKIVRGEMGLRAALQEGVSRTHYYRLSKKAADWLEETYPEVG